MGVYYVSGVPFGDELYHHGIKGQKWGLRRFQNLDGSLTAAGRERYGNNVEGVSSGYLKRQVMRNQYFAKNTKTQSAEKKFNKELNKLGRDPFFGSEENHKASFKLVKDFMREYASTTLSDLGYTPNERQIEYLINQKWFTSPYAYLYGKPLSIK